MFSFARYNYISKEPKLRKDRFGFDIAYKSSILALAGAIDIKVHMFTKFKNSKKRGDAGLGVAIAWFTAEGYTVSIPLTDSQDYDLVVGNENNLQRVQVTTCTQKQKSGRYVIELRTVSYGGKDYNIKHFDGKSVDLLFVITGDGIKYLIPVKEFEEHRRSLTLSEEYRDFELTEIIVAPWPSGKARVCKTLTSGPNPLGASRI